MMMGVREHRPVLWNQWQTGSEGPAEADGPGTHAPGAGAMVRHVAAGPGLDGGSRVGGAGAGPAHYRTMGRRLRRGRPRSFDFRADWGCPPALDQAQQEELKGVVQQPPATSGIELANWYWKVVRQYVSERYCIGSEPKQRCLNYLHRLGFAFKRPKKRLLKADAETAPGGLQWWSMPP